MDQCDAFLRVLSRLAPYRRGWWQRPAILESPLDGTAELMVMNCVGCREGNLIDTVLSVTRDMKAAQRWFRSARSVVGLVQDRVTIDGHNATLASHARRRYLDRMSSPPEDTSNAATRHEHFLHLLTELEQVVEEDVIEWNAASALTAQRRLDRLAAIVRRIAAGIRKH